MRVVHAQVARVRFAHVMQRRYEKLFPHRAGLPDKMRSEQINGQSLGAWAAGASGGGAQEHFPAGP